MTVDQNNSPLSEDCKVVIPSSSTNKDSSLQSTHRESSTTMTISDVLPESTDKADKADKSDYLSVSNENFLTGIFGTEVSETCPIVCGFIGDPGKVSGANWAGQPWIAGETNTLGSDKNWYFTTSRYISDSAGKYRRTNKQFVSLHAIVLDDIGTKASGRDRLEALRPSWLIETSSGNFQAGYIFTEPMIDGAAADALCDALVSAGLCDAGAKSPRTRYGRLPVSINGKHEPEFSCKLVEWHPELRYTPTQIIDGLELTLPELKIKIAVDVSSVGAPFSKISEDEVYTPKFAENLVITELKERGLYKSPFGSGKHDITCPWVHEHTDAIDNGTAYFEPRRSNPKGGFKCQHGHCNHRHIGVLLDHLSITTQAAENRPIINVKKGKLDRIVDVAERELTLSGLCFQRGGLIVSIVTDPGTKETTINAVNQSGLMRELSRIATWEQYDGRSKGMVETDPPIRHISVLYDSTSYPHLLVLNGIARQPYLRNDGSLMSQSGYDNATGMFGVFDESEFNVKDNPSRKDAEVAMAEMQRLLNEFGFETDHDRSAAIASMLTATIRSSLQLAPMFHIKAPQIASGKSFLSTLISAFATPTSPSALSFPQDDEECRKLLLATLLTAPAVACFDNLTTDLIPHKSLCSALTEEFLTGRILGVSKTATVGTRTLFLSSGNNVGPVRDMARRCVTISLDPACELPTERVFKFDPVKLVKENRAHYVSLSLTIIRAWIAEGKSMTSCKSLASYGQWSNLVRQPMLWLGLADPAQSVFETIADDPDREILGRLMHIWFNIFGKSPTMVRDVVKAVQEIAKNDDYVELHEIITEIAEKQGRINRGRLGWWIKRHAGCQVGGFKFVKATGKRNAEQWLVVSVSSGLSSLSVVSPTPPKNVTPEDGIHPAITNTNSLLLPPRAVALPPHVTQSVSRQRLEGSDKLTVPLH